jgi:thioredoxin-like negative regulator of GroEL
MIEARTLDGLKQLLADHNKVVVDFWSPNCGPCKAFAPVFEKVEGEMLRLAEAATQDQKEFESVLFVKCNVAEASEVIREFGLKAVPTILGFSGGVKTSDKTGMLNEQAFFTFVQAI